MPARGKTQSDQDSSARRTLNSSNYMMLLLCVIVAAGLFLKHHNAKNVPVKNMPFSAVDVRGKRVTLASAPERIVSIAPAETEILYAIGLGPKIVADTTWCTYPPEAKKLPHIGDMNISVEKVVAMRPDVVFASLSANGDVIQRIENAGIRVFAVDPESFPQLFDTIKTIGILTGHIMQAQALVQSMGNKVDYVRKLAAQYNSHPSVLYVIQAQPLWVAGKDTFIDQLISMAGGVNVMHDSGKGYFSIPPEVIFRKDPDIVLTNPENKKLLLSSSAWKDLRAVKEGKIFCPNTDRFNRPGPRLADALQEVAGILYPSLHFEK
jgi:iron complex transport system substrate-binding protein